MAANGRPVLYTVQGVTCNPGVASEASSQAGQEQLAAIGS